MNEDSESFDEIRDRVKIEQVNIRCFSGTESINWSEHIILNRKTILAVLQSQLHYLFLANSNLKRTTSIYEDI